MAYNAKETDGAQITVLRYPENVRQRVGMYLSSKEHAIFEIVDNSIDEYLAGYATTIIVSIDKDNCITIRDDGRGIPVEPHKDPEYEGLSQVEVAATVLHAGGKFDDAEDAYKTVTAGLNGVGLSCVNATSSQMSISVYKEGKIHNCYFEKGYIVQNLSIIGEDDEAPNGTEISFVLDPEIWDTNTPLNTNKIKTRLQQLSYLNPGLTLVFQNESDGIDETYYHPDGLNEYITKIVGVKVPVIENVIKKNGTVNDVEISIAMTYTDTYTNDILTFVNNINTEDGGDHLIGFRSGLLKTLNTFALDNKIIKEDHKFEANDVLEGLTAIVSIKVKEPHFISQAKNKIDMRHIRSIISNFTEEMIIAALDKYPDDAQNIISKCVSAYNARKAAQRARENVRKNKDILDGSLAGKIADCQSKDPKECEVFIVEGNSAGGTAKAARDRKYQAILPIFGKVLNVEKTHIDKVYANEKLLDVLRALKCGIGEEFDVNKLRYDKIILASDADVDGAHIRILYITFFYRYLKQIITDGHLYMACPPLFKISKNKNIRYAYSDEERDQIVSELGNNCIVNRFKGLGEMDPEPFWDTTMNPETRKIIQVTVEDAEAADQMLTLCMGTEVKDRRDFIIENALSANIDV